MIGQVSAITPLKQAIDGTAKKRRRAPTKKINPNSDIATSAVCYCGARFDDFREAYLHVRNGCEEFVRIDEARRSDGKRLVAAHGTRSGYNRHLRQQTPPCEPCRAASQAYEREQRADPEYRERKREWGRRRRANPEYREQQREQQRERRADPEYRERERERERLRREAARRELAMKSVGL